MHRFSVAAALFFASCVVTSPALAGGACGWQAASGRHHFALSAPCPPPNDAYACVGPATLVVRDAADVEIRRISLASACIVRTNSGALVTGAARRTLYDDEATIVTGDFDFDDREDFAVQARRRRVAQDGHASSAMKSRRV